MKKSFIGLLVLLFFVTTGIEGQQDLRVATFNCEFLVLSKVHKKFGLPLDLRNVRSSSIEQWKDKTFRANKFREACASVAVKIKEIDADVIGLTEIGKKAEAEILHEELVKIGVNYKFREVSTGSDPTGQRVAIFSKYRLKNVERRFNERSLYYIETDLDESRETLAGGTTGHV